MVTILQRTDAEQTILDEFNATLETGESGWENYLRPWLRALRARVDNDLDALVAITGEEGVGKSTLALQLALRIDPYLWLGQVFNDAHSFRHEAANRPEGSVLVLDEAFEGALNRQHGSRSNIGLVKWLGEARALRHFMFVAFPRYQNLDPYLRRHRVAYRVHVPERGVGEVYETETDKFGRRDPWQSLVCRFRFGPLDWHPIWEPYQEQKKQRIRDRNEELATQHEPSGLTRRETRAAVEEGYIGRYEACRDFVANGHARDLDAAAVALASMTDQPPERYHPNKSSKDEMALSSL